MTTLGAALRVARSRLVDALGLDSSVAGLEAQVLLSHVLKRARAHLLTYPEAALSDANLAQFEALLARRALGEPIAYLTGLREFYGLEFFVTPDVLIPRPETELLVELALEHIPHDTPARVLDLGTGSGAIAISIAQQRPLAQITAVDRSRSALDIAQKNAARLGCANIRFVESDWFAALDPENPFDLIASNPPYIAIADPHLVQGDVKSEPITALVSGPDGLDAIRHIADVARAYLQVSGHLFLEHGHDQGIACREILQRHAWKRIRSYQDLAGLDRISGGQL